MSAAPVSQPAELQVVRAVPSRLAGAPATRYTLRRDHAYTGDAELDAAFSTFDAVVASPRRGAPLVTLMNGITKPLAHSVPAAAEALRAGLGVALVETPLGGRRRPGAADRPGDALALLARRGVALDVPFAARTFDGVALDLAGVVALCEAEHGLGAERRALFGVSFGGLLSAYAFGRSGLGDRLLGAIVTPHLPAMARGLVSTATTFGNLPPSVVAGGLRMGTLADAAARRFGGDAAVGALRFARLLDRLGRGGSGVDAFDPLAFASPDRPAAFLAGALDPVAPPSEVQDAAVAWGAPVEVVGGLGHGWFPGARPAGTPPFGELCGAWLVRQLADW